MKHYSAKEILDILHSIESVSLDEDGCLEVKDKSNANTAYITSFEPDSFTYDLLRLIEQHMIPKIQVKQCKLGWSFTDGHKWFFYAYSTKEVAQEIYDRIVNGKEGWNEERLQLQQIRYDMPLQLVY